MEDTAQLYDMIMKLSDRVLELELQVSVGLIQLKEHVHPLAVEIATRPAVLLREQQIKITEIHEPPPDYQDDGLD